MLSKELCERWHGLEMPVKISVMKLYHNCVVLATPEKGISVKPYPKNDLEEELLLRDLTIYLNNDREVAISRYSEPTFCFLRGGRDLAEEAAENVLMKLYHKDLSYSDLCKPERVQCPHAY